MTGFHVAIVLNRGCMLICCQFILSLVALILLPIRSIGVPVNNLDRCITQYQIQNPLILALEKDLSWEDIKKLPYNESTQFSKKQRTSLIKLKKNYINSTDSLLQADRISLINVLLFSNKLTQEELTKLTLDELFPESNSRIVLSTLKSSLGYLNKLKNNFIFGRFLGSLSSFFDQIYLSFENDPQLQRDALIKIKSTISVDISKFVAEQLAFTNNQSRSIYYPSHTPSVQNITSILNDAHLSLGDQYIVRSLVTDNTTLAWHWPYSRISFDTLDQTASFSQMNKGSSIIYSSSGSETKALGKQVIQVPTLTDHVSIQMYPPNSFDHSPFSYAYSRNYMGRIPNEIIESINLFDKTLDLEKVSYLTITNSNKTIGTLRIYEVDQTAPMEFELGRRGVELKSSAVLKSWSEKGKPVFELGRFTLAEDATREERDSFFRFLDLVFYNLARLYPNAEFICETGKSSLYRMYRIKWGFDLMEPVIKTNLDELHILSVSAETLLQKTKNSLESLRQN